MSAPAVPLIVSLVLPDGRIGTVDPTLYGGRLGVAPADDPLYYEDVWDFLSLDAAVAALLSWDGTGEPIGWHRHPRTGRRRPDGDPAREHVHP